MIPHAGRMCLLDEVTQWNEATIRCISRSHRDGDNPLRAGPQLPALCGIEYAAQAMAVHGRLAAIIGATPSAGYIASLRDVVCHAGRLDDLDDELVIDAERMMGDAQLVVYQFAVSAGGTEILRGRATVVLDAG